MRGIIGHTGFVGSNIIEHMQFEHMFNSKTISNISSYNYDLIVCAGMSSLKWYANKNPKDDLENINNLINILKGVICKKFVLISTSDVYEKTSNNPYLEKCTENHHAYGRNRYHAEEELKKIFNDITIIRLPSVFGKNLKKNLIYDLINNKLYKKLNLCDTLQWYDCGDLANDIKYAIDKDISELNLFTEPITMKEIVETFFDIDSDKTYFDCENSINYNLPVNSGSLDYWNSKEEILKKLKFYLDGKS